MNKKETTISPKQEAIRKMLNFTNLIDIHSKNKYICSIKLEFKDKRHNNKGYASLDMNNDSEFGDILSGGMVDDIKKFFEDAAIVEIDEQRAIRIKQEAKESEDGTS